MQEKIASLGYEFRSEVIAAKSLGAARLCQWINGLLHYCHVLYQMQDFDLWTKETEKRLLAVDTRLRELNDAARAAASTAKTPQGSKGKSPARSLSPKSGGGTSPRRTTIGYRMSMTGIRTDPY